MSQIGQFKREKTGFVGRLHTLFLYRDLTLIATERADAENAPDYRIHLGDQDGPEVGAGWKRTGERAGDYVSLLIDDPTFRQPIRANLFQSGDDETAWSLHWTRPAKRKDQD